MYFKEQTIRKQPVSGPFWKQKRITDRMSSRLGACDATSAQQSDGKINLKQRRHQRTLEVVACRRRRFRLSCVVRPYGEIARRVTGRNNAWGHSKSALYPCYAVARQRLRLRVIRWRVGVTVDVWRASKRIKCSREFIFLIPRTRDVSIQIFSLKTFGPTIPQSPGRRPLRTQIYMYIAMCLYVTTLPSKRFETVWNTFSVVPITSVTLDCFRLGFYSNEDAYLLTNFKNILNYLNMINFLHFIPARRQDNFSQLQSRLMDAGRLDGRGYLVWTLYLRTGRFTKC